MYVYVGMYVALGVKRIVLQSKFSGFRKITVMKKVSTIRRHINRR